MADRVEYLRRMVELVDGLVQDGFSREEIAEIHAADDAHVDGDAQVPYVRVTCSNCGSAESAWNECRRAPLVRSPCRRCGKPW